MGLDTGLIDGQTPLDEEETDGLLIPMVTTRWELDEFEQQNIEQAIKWTMGRRFKKDQILTEDFLKLVHRKMFGEVWAWAGQFRKSNKNIGVDRYDIATELRKLLGDCAFWVDNEVYLPDEAAIRFKHRIVQIHCFPNGNGRHSRMMGDLIIEKIFNRSPFTWGGHGDLARTGEVRRNYLSAIKVADNGNITPLLDFARM